MWSKIKHRNITPLLGVCFGFAQSARPGLVHPAYRNGTIIEYLQKHPHANTMNLVSRKETVHRDSYLIAFQVYQAASGLQHMHDLNTVHGDLKAVGSSCDNECVRLNLT